jgi:hypothetical protein
MGPPSGPLILKGPKPIFLPYLAMFGGILKARRETIRKAA